MAKIDFSFEDVSPADANRLAVQWQRTLVREGVDPDSVSVVRGNAETQNYGEIVQWLTAHGPDVFDYARTMIEFAAIAKGLSELCIRHDCAVRIRGPRGEIRIGRGEADGERIRTYLTEVLDDPRNADKQS